MIFLSFQYRNEKIEMDDSAKLITNKQTISTRQRCDQDQTCLEKVLGCRHDERECLHAEISDSGKKYQKMNALVNTCEILIVQVQPASYEVLPQTRWLCERKMWTVMEREREQVSRSLTTGSEHLSKRTLVSC